MTDQQDTVMANPAVDADAAGSPPPTGRELELLRLLELKQHEADDLASTLTLLTQNPAARPPPLPLPAPPAPAALEPSDQKLVIPRALLPVFAHLRAHCTALAAQNDELLAVLAEASVDGGGGSAASNGAPATASEGQPKRRQVDLAKVVDRLRVLSDENRELEGVVESLGRQVGEARGLKAALEEAHDAILTLDSDLEHSYGQIEALQAMLADYAVHFGPLPAASAARGAPSDAMSS